mmetsp:Transcript_6669/g.19018  ORF Transcript_6669/g.19018 Transcript_6669/m.19018 type:complete len:142 (+) Transcript_6669:715-1140(+)
MARRWSHLSSNILFSLWNTVLHLPGVMQFVQPSGHKKWNKGQIEQDCRTGIVSVTVVVVVVVPEEVTVAEASAVEADVDADVETDEPVAAAVVAPDAVVVAATVVAAPDVVDAATVVAGTAIARDVDAAVAAGVTLTQASQ